MKYFIVCPERMKDEEDVVWWKPNYRGYTKNIEEAGRYTKEEVDKICNQPNVDDYGVPETKYGNPKYRMISNGPDRD